MQLEAIAPGGGVMPQPIGLRPTPWRTVVLLCGKCARKMDGGYGRKKQHTLRSALRAELKATGRRRRVRIIETSCMGICPKKAVTALNASQPERILTVPKGTPAPEALASLMPAEASRYGMHVQPNEAADGLNGVASEEDGEVGTGDRRVE